MKLRSEIARQLEEHAAALRQARKMKPTLCARKSEVALSVSVARSWPAITTERPWSWSLNERSRPTTA